MIKLGMLSYSDSVKGQGVGSAYSELVHLLEKYGKADFSLSFNARAGKSDLYHMHSIDPISYLRMKFTKKPKVISIHMTPEMARNSVRLPGCIMKIFQKYLMWVYTNADYVHIVNPDEREAIRSFGYPDNKIHYIPNFVSKNSFYKMDSGKRSALRKKNGYDDQDFIAFADGQIREGKGIADFVEVAKLLPDVKFIWAGGFPSGPLADGYPKMKEILAHLPENVRFPGIVEREEINELLNISDLFFFPSYQELFPMSILEAANVHLPLLLRDLPEYQNILAGKFLHADTHEEFAEKIRLIRDDPTLRQRLTDHAIEIATKYSEENTYRIWKQFYTECVNNQGK